MSGHCHRAAVAAAALVAMTKAAPQSAAAPDAAPVERPHRSSKRSAELRWQCQWGHAEEHYHLRGLAVAAGARRAARASGCTERAEPPLPARCDANGPKSMHAPPRASPHRPKIACSRAREPADRQAAPARPQSNHRPLDSGRRWSAGRRHGEFHAECGVAPCRIVGICTARGRRASGIVRAG